MKDWSSMLMMESQKPLIVKSGSNTKNNSLFKSIVMNETKLLCISLEYHIIGYITETGCQLFLLL
ncbi:MAG: hypothetical protein EOM50_21435 [Erysipelotrichia bacterium]|nr:hypothetical protein [Erysipelotrichia bacterium]